MEKFSSYSEYIRWFRQINTTIQALSEQEFYQSNRYLLSREKQVKKRSSLQNLEQFSEYEEYLEWFTVRHPNITPLDKDEFYHSSRYKQPKISTSEKINKNHDNYVNLNDTGKELNLEITIILSDLQKLFINQEDK